MQQTNEVGLLTDGELRAREEQALEAWIQANATAVAARAWHDAAVRADRGVRAVAKNLLTATAAEHAARDHHRALSDELARRGLAPSRARRAA